MIEQTRQEEFIIHRAMRGLHLGFILEWIGAEGKSLFCGADRNWVGSADDVRTLFRTFTGVEWYRSEWTILKGAVRA
jgi:hypothetical protein